MTGVPLKRLPTGGPTRDENITTKTKVPLLCDIPIVGQAFRTDKQSRSKTELYIIVTPRSCTVSATWR